MIALHDDDIVFSFPEVLRIHFVAQTGKARLVRDSSEDFLIRGVGPVVMHLRPTLVGSDLSEPGPGVRYPFVVLLSVDGVNVLTGKRSSTLARSPQNYFSTPPQGAVDGYLLDGQVHPFRADAESASQTSRLEIAVFPMKNAAWEYFRRRKRLIPGPGPFIQGLTLDAGGERTCEPVYEDLCSLGDWDQARRAMTTVWLKRS